MSKNKMYEDIGYIQPPSYDENIKEDMESESDTLIVRLKYRIQKDLLQINGVYKSEIEDSIKIMEKKIKELRDDNNIFTHNINLQRKKEIEKYNTQAENRIGNLISSIEECKNPEHTDPYYIKVFNWFYSE